MFMVGLISMSILMYIQGKPILCIQQLISLIPAVIGFIKNIKQEKLKNNMVKNNIRHDKDTPSA